MNAEERVIELETMLKAMIVKLHDSWTYCHTRPVYTRLSCASVETNFVTILDVVREDPQMNKYLHGVMYPDQKETTICCECGETIPTPENYNPEELYYCPACVMFQNRS